MLTASPLISWGDPLSDAAGGGISYLGLASRENACMPRDLGGSKFVHSRSTVLLPCPSPSGNTMARSPTLSSSHSWGHRGQQTAAWTFLRKMPIVLWLLLLDTSLPTARSQATIPLET